MASFYEKHDIAVCPDGDKVRSDDDGLFCIVAAVRVPARVVNGQTVLDFPVVPVVVPPVAAAGASKSKKKGEPDLLSESITLIDPTGSEDANR